MVYLRSKKNNGRTYYYVVEGNRDEEGKVKQKVKRYLGNVENIIEKFDFWDKHH